MKIDLHVHTSEVSKCGHMSAAETVGRYKDAGYDCIVITNHFNSYTADLFAQAGKPDFFEHYRSSYLLAKEEGERAGLLVLNGYEIRFNGADNDYLIYGMDDATAKEYKTLFAMDPKSFSALAAERGFLFYQAHPFRNQMKITNPAYLFGIEIKNGNPRHDSRNDIAHMWAKKYGLHMIAGSDCHQQQDVGVTGVLTKRAVKDEAGLLAMLREDDYTVI